METQSCACARYLLVASFGVAGLSCSGAPPRPPPGASTAQAESAEPTASASPQPRAESAPVARRQPRRQLSEVHSLRPDDQDSDDATFTRGANRFSRDGAGAGISITLNNSFIEQYKHRATIDATYTIDAASKVHATKDDGEIHIAGRAPEIELPIVAEIMQAKGETKTIAKVRALAGTGTPIAITGAWRIWCEHAGGSSQLQGGELEAFTTSNPDHVFEIHPVTRFGDVDLARTFTPTQGYTPKEAENAFMSYERVPSKITIDGETTTIETRAAGNNFVEFVMRVESEPRDVGDGRFLIASALSPDGDLIVRHRRMVFVKGTPPFSDSERLQADDCIHVVGIPRIDLALISWRTHHAQDRPEALDWNLPYEIVVVASKGRASCEK